MQYGTHQGYASSAYAPETTEPPSSTSSRHGHSLSLGQIPHSTTSTTSTTGYAAPRGQTAQQHQQQHAIPSHARSFSASASTSSSNNTNNAANSSPYLSPYMAAATTSTSAGGDSNNSNPASRTQTISPLMGHAHLGQYSQGLGLAGVPATASHASSSATAPMYPPYIQQQQSQHSSMPAYTSNLHGTITPPSPSTGHASSLRHSFSDNAGASLPYTPQSYTSGSSLPSSYNTLASSKHQSSYDAHSLSSLPSSYGHHHHHQYSSTYPPYPLSHSAQGFMTVYTASPMYGCKDSQIHLEVGVAPHDPHYIRGFRVLFGSHGTTTRVVGETRAEGEERVDLVAITPPAHLTNRIPPNGSTCQLSLQALDEGGNVADWADLGVFEFTGEFLSAFSSAKSRRAEGFQEASGYLYQSLTQSSRVLYGSHHPPLLQFSDHTRTNIVQTSRHLQKDTKDQGRLCQA